VSSAQTLPVSLQPLAPVVDRVGGPRRALILLVGLLVAGLILGVSRWATAPTWVPAFPEVPVEQAGKLTDKLTEAGVDFRLAGGGTAILVKTQDLARARVTLARDGGLPNAGRPGLELFDQPSWGMTDFTQRINYRRALEGELERTIGKMQGVERAQVHVAMSETQAFRRSDRPLEASVVLQLRSGDRPSADVVQGIQHLVAASVDGLDSDHVTVVDDGGRMLTLDAEAGSLAGLTSRQLSLQREVEGYLEKKASDIVGQIVGGRNARVQVSAVVNFDKVERTTEAVDPDKQAVSTEQRAEITPGAQGGAASTNVATSYETTKSVETFSGAIGNVRKLTVAVLVNDRASGGPKPTTVPRTPAELARIDTLVRNAVGIDSARGDQLAVVNVAFDGTGIASAAVDEAPTVWTRIEQYQRPIAGGAALVALVVVGVVTMRILRGGAQSAADAARPALDPAYAAAVAAAAQRAGLPVTAPALTGDAATDAANQALALAAGADPAALAAGDARPPILISPGHRDPVVLHELTSPVRDQVVAIIEQRPEAATRVLRNWMRQD
jgi:flagellar M-ring protein FliF